MHIISFVSSMPNKFGPRGTFHSRGTSLVLITHQCKSPYLEESELEILSWFEPLCHAYTETLTLPQSFS